MVEKSPVTFLNGDEVSLSSEHEAFRDLSPAQEKAFAELKSLCAKNNVSWLVSDFKGNSDQGANDDHTLLRYLRARNYDPQAAFKQYSESASWRRKHQLDKTYDDVEIDDFETMRRLQPQWTGRRDRNGVPVMVYVVADVSTEDIVKAGEKDPELSSIFLPAEYVTQFVQPLCAALHRQGHVASSNNIIDLSNVGVKTFWNLRKLLQKASNMATAHYPETVERIFVVGAPSFFPTIWKFIMAWFEPATTRKISILSAHETTSVLTKFIAPEDLPKRFGGTLEWDFGRFPNLDKEALDVTSTLGSKWIDGPLRFIKNKNGGEVIAVGMENGNARREHL